MFAVAKHGSDAEAQTAAKEFMKRVAEVMSVLRRLRVKEDIKTKMTDEGITDMSGSNKAMLLRLANAMLRSPDSPPAGCSKPMPGGEEQTATTLASDGVSDVTDSLFRLDSVMPCTPAKVHCDFHMGNFVIERFKQYVAPYNAKDPIERMAWILGRQTTLNKKPILQAHALFIPQQASTGTAVWQSSEASRGVMLVVFPCLS